MSVLGYRALIILVWLLMAASLVLELFFPSPDLAAVQDYIHQLETESLFDHISEAMLVIMLASLLSLFLLITYGLLTFKNWARYLNAITLLGLLPVSGFLGLSVYSPAADAINQLIYIIEGCVMGMTFYSPLATKFERSH